MNFLVLFFPKKLQKTSFEATIEAQNEFSGTIFSTINHFRPKSWKIAGPWSVVHGPRTSNFPRLRTKMIEFSKISHLVPFWIEPPCVAANPSISDAYFTIIAI